MPNIINEDDLLKKTICLKEGLAKPLINIVSPSLYVIP